jgi:hypothetical protein
MGAQGRPRGILADTGHDPLGAGLECGGRGGAQVVLGGDVQSVEVAGGGVAEPEPVGEACSRCVVVAETGASSRARTSSRRSVAVGGWTLSGRMIACGSPSPTTCR